MSANEMTSCIEACHRCAATCLATAMHHCLEAGGKHTEPRHFRLMMACVEVCRASDALMLLGAPSQRMRASRPPAPAPRNAAGWPPTPGPNGVAQIPEKG